MNSLGGVVILMGAVSTLAYFQFSLRKKSVSVEAVGAAQRPPLLNVLAGLGQVFIGITLGAVFAGVYAASLSALIERIDFVIGIVMKIF
jgi:carbon starvation protein CstA